MPDERPHARFRLRCRDLSAAARRRHAGAQLDARRAGAHHGFLITHNEVDLDRRLFHAARRPERASIARPATTPITRATTRCCRCTKCSAPPGKMQPKWHILDENEIVDGIDELGVLLYGHAKNAYWYGSQLSIEETRALAPYQNATGMQVTSAVLAGMVWALENPDRRHRRGRRNGFPPLPGNPAAVSRPGDRAITPTGRRSTTGPDCFPEDIDTRRSLAVQQRAGAGLIVTARSIEAYAPTIFRVGFSLQRCVP